MEKIETTERGGQAKREKQIVLVVDGDLTRQFLTAIVLQRLHYQVFPVKTAEEALVILELTVPLVILTDIILPRMNGIDFLKNVKQNPRTRDIPVLIYTPLVEQSYREECAREGSADFITMPAETNRLYEAIQSLTEKTPRHFVRLDTSFEATVEDGAAEKGGRREKVRALSQHGMFVNTSHPLPSGTVVPFTLYLDPAMERGINVEGEVLYSQAAASSSGKIPGMSIKFVKVKSEDAELIRNFIRDNLMAGIEKNKKTEVQWPR